MYLYLNGGFRGVLEKIYTVLDTIGNFFGWCYDGIIYISDWLGSKWGYFIGLLGVVPDIAAVAVALIVAVAIVFLIVGR